MNPARRSRASLLGAESRSYLSLPSSSRVKKVGSSSAIAATSQAKLQLFKEAFSLIDKDGSGCIGKDDLKATCEMLGMNLSDKQAEEMLGEVTGAMNLTTFACMLASRTGDLDNTDMLMNAFGIIDENQDGKLPMQSFCKMLHTTGYERLSKAEIAEILKIAPVDKDGMLNYREFVDMIRGVVHE